MLLKTHIANFEWTSFYSCRYIVENILELSNETSIAHKRSTKMENNILDWKNGGKTGCYLFLIFMLTVFNNVQLQSLSQEQEEKQQAVAKNQLLQRRSLRKTR